MMMNMIIRNKIRHSFLNFDKFKLLKNTKPACFDVSFKSFSKVDENKDNKEKLNKSITINPETFKETLKTSSESLQNGQTTPQSDQQNVNETHTQKRKGFLKRSKEKINEYGRTGLIFYILCYIGGGYLFLILVRNKYIDKEQFLILCDKYKVERYIDVRQKIKKAGDGNTDLVLAIAMNEMFELIRIPAVILILGIVFRRRKNIKK